MTDYLILHSVMFSSSNSTQALPESPRKRLVTAASSTVLMIVNCAPSCSSVVIILVGGSGSSSNGGDGSIRQYSSKLILPDPIPSILTALYSPFPHPFPRLEGAQTTTSSSSSSSSVTRDKGGGEHDPFFIIDKLGWFEEKKFGERGDDEEGLKLKRTEEEE